MSATPQPVSALPLSALPVQAIPAGRRIAASAIPVADADTAEPAPAAAPHKGFSFWDLVDVVNPLQHIPVVNSIYRKITGDEISGFARVAGGALYGGFAGAAFGMLNAAVADNTGKDIGDTILSAFEDDDTPATDDAPETNVAASQTDAAPAKIADTQATGGSLFDTVAPHAATGRAVVGQAGTDAAAPAPAPAPAPAIPVIEVRPQARAAAANNAVHADALPAAKDLAQLDAAELNAIMPGQPAVNDPLAPKPVDKAQVQQAMMDALLKMQSHRGDDDDTASEKS